MEKQGNLTEGPILKVLTKLALPIMASAFLSTAYSITDMAWVGMLGSEAVAGIGVGGMYMWLSSGLATLAKTGGQVNVAQAIGRGRREDSKNYANAAVQLGIIFGIVFGLMCLVFTKSLIGFFELDGAYAVQSGIIYLKITGGMVIFSYLGIILTGIYTAQGDSKTPLKANFCGLVLNMILDPLLILGVGPFPKMEAAGAAIATVVAQFVVTSLLIFFIRNKSQENVLKEIEILKKPDKRYLGPVIKIGGPIALQSMLYCGISMILSKFVTMFGDGAMATQRVGGQVEAISWNTADGFASAMNSFAAQNYGAGKMDRVKKGYKVSAITVGTWGLVVTAVFMLSPIQLSSLFFYEPEVINLCAHYFFIIGVGEAFMCIELMAVGALSGLGQTKLCSIISIILTGMRIPLAYVLSNTALGLDGIWWALTISSISKGIALHFAFHRSAGKLTT